MKAITPQERNVLELIGKGYSTQKIALILDISFHTVQSHRKNLLNKFNAANSAELMRKASQGDSLSDFLNDSISPT